MNYKTRITSKIDEVLKVSDATTADDLAIRKLGIGYALASKGEALKKEAKAALKKLGIIPATFQPGTATVLADTDNYVLTSKTADSNRRLNEAALKAALDAERLTAPAKARIMAAAYVEGTPATSYTVEQK